MLHLWGVPVFEQQPVWDPPFLLYISFFFCRCNWDTLSGLEASPLDAVWEAEGTFRAVISLWVAIKSHQHKAAISPFCFWWWWCCWCSGWWWRGWRWWWWWWCAGFRPNRGERILVDFIRLWQPKVFGNRHIRVMKEPLDSPHLLWREMEVQDDKSQIFSGKCSSEVLFRQLKKKPANIIVRLQIRQEAKQSFFCFFFKEAEKACGFLMGRSWGGWDGRREEGHRKGKEGEEGEEIKGEGERVRRCREDDGSEGNEDEGEERGAVFPLIRPYRSCLGCQMKDLAASPPPRPLEVSRVHSGHWEQQSVIRKEPNPLPRRWGRRETHQWPESESTPCVTQPYSGCLPQTSMRVF